MKNIFIVAAALIFLSFIPNKAEKQILKTSLQITVLNELGSTVKEANVQLFKTEDDYFKGENPVTEKLLTDAKGKVTFKDLEPIEYYVNVEKDGATNDGAGAKTGKLVEKRINKVNVIIME